MHAGSSNGSERTGCRVREQGCHESRYSGCSRGSAELSLMVRGCGLQIYRQHSEPGRIHDASHPGQGGISPLSALECDVDVFIAQQKVCMVGPVCLGRYWNEAGLSCHEISSSM